MSGFKPVQASAEPNGLSEESDRQKALFMSLLQDNRAVLSRVAIRLCGGDSALAEDCVQDAVVSAYKSFLSGRLHDHLRFRPWILTILTNAFLVSHRKLKWTVPTADVELLVEVRQRQTAEPAPSDPTLSDELVQALASISPDHRACVVLVDIEQLEYAEAAQALGVPVGTVRSRLNRARLKMAEEIMKSRNIGVAVPARRGEVPTMSSKTEVASPKEQQ